ncbi:kinesin motor protein cin8 [Gonapodya sp. JEL0774]|nr:kinesin motor protein cin8 [Gonapodya sp. JEL0774]
MFLVLAPDRFVSQTARVIISDGTFFMQGMLATQLNDICNSGLLQRNGIFRIKEFVVNNVSSRTIAVILNIDVLTPNNPSLDRIGHPKNIEEVGADFDLVQGGAAQPHAAFGNVTNGGYNRQEPHQQRPGMGSGQQVRPYGGEGTYRSQSNVVVGNGVPGVPEGLGPIFPISHLSPYQNKWTIRARAVNKSDIKTWTNQRGEGSLFSVTFVDESGEIRVTAFNDSVKTFYDVIQENQVYYISRASVKQAKRQWGVQNEYEMTLEPSSVVERCDDGNAAAVPGMKFNFVRLDRLLEYEKDQTIDVVGIIHSISDVSTIIGKQSNKTVEKRELTLVDDSSRQVRLTLWGKQATDFRAEDKAVVAVKGARLGDFGGRTLSVSAGCTLTYNPDIPEAAQLRAWYDHLPPGIEFSSYSNAGGPGGGLRDSKRDEFKTISQIKDENLGQKETADFFNIRGTIIFIRNENVAYPACPSSGCNKRVTEEAPGQWRCEKCNKTYPEPFYRYILSVSVSDHTGQTWLTAFHDVGVELLGMEAGALLKLKDNGAPGDYDAVFNDATFKMFDFRLRAKSDTYNEETRTRIQIQAMTHLKWKEASKQLAQTIEAYEKMAGHHSARAAVTILQHNGPIPPSDRFPALELGVSFCCAIEDLIAPSIGNLHVSEPFAADGSNPAVAASCFIPEESSNSELQPSAALAMASMQSEVVFSPGKASTAGSSQLPPRELPESKETNIQVVVRLRPRSTKEIRDNSPALITAGGSGAIGREVNVRMFSSEATHKTYTFDRVFGPEADQENIYNGVVQPILEEVLMGYNCTIFAYGQTGTGKTYTMEGSLDALPNSQAGIIPRSLHRLFETLESQSSDFSVRVSMLELYNEELRDLLAPEALSGPGASVSSSTATGAVFDSQKLRLYDEQKGRGIIIQGLEEVLAKNVWDVLAALRKGAERRQTAGTQLNDKSSRSHCVFSVTVHIKEATADGEDLLKVGKLNLVDLAGSENIGRSGAENKRAREAGMINQSLLTLGRVINALVDKSPHVPYRESKLTRLLQDSLGGRTKTCIIATISPAKANIEESLSTLDYAHRAKNIRNKPEINQKMSKKALLKEYVNEIERLRLDLQLMESHQSGRDRVSELEKERQAKEENLRRRDEENARLKEELIQQREARKQLQLELEESRAETKRVKSELEQTMIRLKEEEVFSTAQTQTAENLNVVSNSFKVLIEKGVDELNGVHSKLERRESLEVANNLAVVDFKMSLGKKLADLEAQSTAFMTKQDQITADVLNVAGSWLEECRKNANKSHSLVATSLANLNDIISQFSSDASLLLSSKDTGLVAILQRAMEAARVTLLALNSYQQDSETAWHKTSHILEISLTGWRRDVRDAVTEMGRECNELAEHIASAIEVWGGEITGLAHEIGSQLENENQRLQRESQSLHKLLKETAVREAEERDMLLARISGLVTEFASNRMGEMGGAVKRACDQFAESGHVGADIRGHLASNAGRVAMVMANRGKELHGDILKVSNMAQETEHKFSVTAQHIRADLAELQDSQEAVTKAFCTETEMKLLTLEGCTGRDAMQSVSALSEHVSENTAQVRGALQQFSVSSQNLSSAFLTTSDGKMKEIGRETDASLTASRDLHQYLAMLRGEVLADQDSMLTRRFQTYSPIGSTPRKRSYKWPTLWETVKDRDTTLTQYRQTGSTGSRSTASPSSMGFAVIDESTQSPIDLWSRVTYQQDESAGKENTSPVVHTKSPFASPSLEICSQLEETARACSPLSDLSPPVLPPLAVPEPTYPSTLPQTKQRHIVSPPLRPSGNVVNPSTSSIPSRPPSANDIYGASLPHGATSKPHERVIRSRIPAPSSADLLSGRGQSGAGSTGTGAAGRLRRGAITGSVTGGK